MLKSCASVISAKSDSQGMSSTLASVCQALQEVCDKCHDLSGEHTDTMVALQCCCVLSDVLLEGFPNLPYRPKRPSILGKSVKNIDPSLGQASQIHIQLSISVK